MRRKTGGTRAVSDVIGFVLVFGLVTSTVALVSVAGVDSLQNVRNAEQANNAERAFDVLADNVEDVFREGAPSRSTEISLQEAQVETGSTVTINVSGITSGGDTDPITGNISVSPIVWSTTESEEHKIVYVFGTVLRTERQGGVVLREPPFVVRDDRMLLPIVNTRSVGPTSLAGTTIRVRSTQTGANVATYGSSDYDTVNISITSPRARTWKRYFEKKDADCEIETATDQNRVECAFDGPDQLYVSAHAIEIELEK